MPNILIILALILQWLILRKSRLLGAILGFLITTSILTWGITVYAEGDFMVFGEVTLPQPIFIIICLAWYALDIKAYLDANRAEFNYSKGRLASVFVWLQWVAASIMGFLAWKFLPILVLPQEYNESTYTILLFLIGTAAGLITGIFQWLILRLILVGSHRWILAGWMLTSGLGWGLSIFLSILMPTPPRSLISAAELAMSGLITGILQWLILRRYLSGAGWWILAVSIDWVVSWLFGFLTPLFTVPPITQSYLYGMVSAIASSTVLVLILHKNRSDDEKREIVS